MQPFTMTMTREHAEDLVLRINTHLEAASDHLRQARELILDLKDGGGWQALGYANWTACKNHAFSRASAQIDREFFAARVELALGRPIGSTPERIARELPAAWVDDAALVFGFAEAYANREQRPLTSGMMREVKDAIAEISATGCFTDDMGEQHPILGALDIDIKTRLLELDARRRQHQQRENRRYIIHNQPVENFVIDIPPDVREQLQGKIVYFSLWTEGE